MVRAPSIRGRPTPERKSKSSVGAASSSLAARGSLLPSRTPMNKALKRAQKRADLLRKTQTSATSSDRASGDDDDHRRARALLRTEGVRDPLLLSKSALRRRKRRAREELAKDDAQGRPGGVRDLADAVDELEEEIMEEEEEAGARGDGYAGSIHAALHGGRVTAKHRKRVLEQEQQRQKTILSNPTFHSSPFSALRQHLHASMGR